MFLKNLNSPDADVFKESWERMKVFICDYPAILPENVYEACSVQCVGTNKSKELLDRKKWAFRYQKLCEILENFYEVRSSQLFRDLHGKLLLKESCFELSCSQINDSFLIALGVENPLGVDMESLDDQIDESTASKFCLKKELVSSKRLFGSYRQKNVSLMIWTAKEAILKALGMGLLIDPLSVEIDVKTGAIVSVPDEAEFLLNYQCYWFLSEKRVLCVVGSKVQTLDYEVCFQSDLKIQSLASTLFD